MYVANMWRYPVKSLGGEPLDVAELTTNGVRGDRIVHVAGAHGPLTGRTRHDLLTIGASTGADGVPRVQGHPWDSPAAAEIVRFAGGVDARLVASSVPERFDVLNLLVATDGAVAEFGSDVRRLRPNLLIGGVGDPDEDLTWPGRALVIGDVVIGIFSVRMRCVVTTIDPDSGVQDLNVFRHIRRRFGGNLALNCWVIRPGTIHAGDPVTLEPTSVEPDSVGGWIVGAPYVAP